MYKIVSARERTQPIDLRNVSIIFLLVPRRGTLRCASYLVAHTQRFLSTFEPGGSVTSFKVFFSLIWAISSAMAVLHSREFGTITASRYAVGVAVSMFPRSLSWTRIAVSYPCRDGGFLCLEDLRGLRSYVSASRASRKFLSLSSSSGDVVFGIVEGAKCIGASLEGVIIRV